jgi:uncharacterized protein
MARARLLSRPRASGGALRRGALLLALAAAAAAPVVVGPATVRAAESSLAGTSWRLVEFQSMDDAIGTLRPQRGEPYTMSLGSDGTASMTLDCNRASGPWSAQPASAESGTFRIGPLAITRALCPEPSLEPRIARDLPYVRSYLLRDGRLHLSLMADGGIYTWEPAAASGAAPEAPAADAAAARGPSFDCSAARPGSVEALVCQDEALAALDRTLAEVYAHARARSADEHPPFLVAEQRGWIKGRDECWKADDERACVEDSYRRRIANLQARYRLVPAKGPVFYACDGNPANELVATFFETDPPTLIAERGDQTSLMYVAPSGSGARYEGRNESFWEHQGEVTLTWGYGSPQLTCVKKPD